MSIKELTIHSSPSHWIKETFFRNPHVLTTFVVLILATSAICLPMGANARVYGLNAGTKILNHSFRAVSMIIPAILSLTVLSFFRFSEKKHNSFLKEAEILKSVPVIAPLPGRCYRFFVHVGDCVHKGSEICEIEVMKMIHTIRSPIDGKVMKIGVEVGKIVDINSQIIFIEPI